MDKIQQIGEKFHGNGNEESHAVALVNPRSYRAHIYRVEIEALIKNGLTQKFIAKRYKTTEGNLVHWMKQHRVKKAKN